MDTYLITWIVLLTILGLGIIKGSVIQRRQKQQAALEMWVNKNIKLQQTAQNVRASLIDFVIAINETNKSLSKYKITITNNN
jgi:hypothetical protein